MSRKIARLALCAAVAVVLPLLEACNSGSGSSEPNGSTSVNANPYSLLTPGVITAGTQSEQPPFAVADATGKPVGFAIDLAEGAAKRLGLRIEYKVTNLTGILAGLAANKYDMGIAGVAATAERAKSIDFVKPYYWGFLAVLTKKESKASSLEDFKDKKVGVVSGSVQETFANARVPGATITKFKDQPAAIAQLLSGGIDGFVVGGADAEEYVAKEPSLKIAVEGDTTQGTSFPIKKGNKALVAAFDAKIDKMIDDGTYMTLYSKWFKRPFSAKLIDYRPGLATAVPSQPATR